MGEIVNINESTKDIVETDTDIIALTEELLLDVRKERPDEGNSISLPLAQLSTLGAGVASLIPAFNTVTQTLSFDSTGLYQVANMCLGDKLKMAKNGNFWGAFKTPEGVSKFAQLREVDPISMTSSTVMNANPAMMMMAVALFSIEKELGDIAEMQKEILSFLEAEKEAEIEADVVTLCDLITKYKHNWNNERFIASNHKLVCDIQRTARKNMIASQKQVEEAIDSKQFIVAGNTVNSTLKDLLKKFKYYRLSVYSFSLASLTEIMLSGNFAEENVQVSIDEIRKNSDEYRELFSRCSYHLEEMSKGAIDTNLLKGVGTISNGLGKAIGSIPKVRDSHVNEFFIEKGQKIKEGAENISKDVMSAFAEVSNPGTAGFINRLEDMKQIYNHTEEICFDKDNLYLVAG